MGLKRIETSNKMYMFVNDSASTRNGFKHISKLYDITRGDIFMIECSMNYINRTWECYTYQTSMQKCVNLLIENEYKTQLEKYKNNNNITRVTKKIREEFEKYFEDMAEIKEYRELYNTL